MSDNPTEPVEPKDEPTPPEPKDGEKDFVSKAEYDKVKRANDWAQGRVRSLETENDGFKSQLEELKKTGPKGGKESEALQNAESEIAKLKADLTNSKTQLRDATVKSTIQQKAVGVIADGAFGDFWAIEGQNFDEVESDDGERKIVHKSKPWMTFDEYFEGLKQEKPWLCKNSRAQGTGEGATPKGDGSGAKFTREQLESMSDKEFQKAAAADPSLVDVLYGP